MQRPVQAAPMLACLPLSLPSPRNALSGVIDPVARPASGKNAPANLHRYVKKIATVRQHSEFLVDGFLPIDLVLFFTQSCYPYRMSLGRNGRTLR